METKTNQKAVFDIYKQRPWLKFYPEGVPAEVDESTEKSVPDAFDEWVERWKDKTALVFYGRKMSYLELKDQVDRLATALCDLGVKKGDVVALLALNSPQYLIALFGALKAGAIVSPISPVYVSREVKDQLEDSGAKTIICQDILYEFVDKAEVDLKTVILANVSEYLPRFTRFLGKSVLRAVYKKMELPSPSIYEKEGFYQFQDLIKKYTPNPPKIEFSPKRDIALLPYSGGTTGLPKGIMLTHYNDLVNEDMMARSLMNVLEEGKEVALLYGPFYHVMGNSSLMTALRRGHTMVILTTPDLDSIVGSIQAYKVTTFGGGPAIYEMFRDYDKTSRVNWKRMKLMFSSADTLLEETQREFEKRTGAKIHQGAGMTEATGATFFSPYERGKFGSWGCPAPSETCAIINPDALPTIEFVPPGEIGEMLITGPHLMEGYWNNPEETKRVFLDIDGKKWLRSGDLVTMDEEGFFYFYDRLRDLIKYKGYSIFPREIEEVLKRHPKIKETGIIGVPDPKVGANIKAFVVLEKEARGNLSEKEIMDFCEENLAHYKVPKIIEFRGEIPKTDVGKVSRRELREEE